jgi:hypothetical protein
MISNSGIRMYLPVPVDWMHDATLQSRRARGLPSISTTCPVVRVLVASRIRYPLPRPRPRALIRVPDPRLRCLAYCGTYTVDTYRGGMAASQVCGAMETNTLIAWCWLLIQPGVWHPARVGVSEGEDVHEDGVCDFRV